MDQIKIIQKGSSRRNKSRMEIPCICFFTCFLVIFCLCGLFSAKSEGKENPAFPEAKPVVPEAKRMVLDILVPTKMLKNTAVLKSMMRVPRALFVPRDLRSFAYQDFALPIGESQTISPPFVVAYMTEQLDPRPTDKILEIGTGSGYQAAVLSPLVSEVYTIEIVRSLGLRADSLLKKMKYENVHCRVGDGYLGWPEAAPFDKIIVTCSPESVPKPLIDQLKEGGKILIPIGDRYQQYFYMITKKGSELVKETLIPAFFVPMTGKAEEERKKQPDPKNPELVGGNFEEHQEIRVWASGEKGDPVKVSSENESAGEKEDSEILAAESGKTQLVPNGWYYTRNVSVEQEPSAPEGNFVLVFDNLRIAEEHAQKEMEEERLRNQEKMLERGQSYLPRRTSFSQMSAGQKYHELTSHALQAFALDGLLVRKLNISCWIRGMDIVPYGHRQTMPVLTLTFFDKDRNSLGESIIVAVPAKDFGWKYFERKEIPVPRKAREGSIRIGVLDGVGQIAFDDIRLGKYGKKSSDKKPKKEVRKNSKEPSKEPSADTQGEDAKDHSESSSKDK